LRSEADARCDLCRPLGLTHFCRRRCLRDAPWRAGADRGPDSGDRGPL